MPIYEFYCPQNRRIYSFFARSLSYSDKIPRCPDNAKWKLEKMVSNFAVTGRAKEKAELPPGAEGMDDARMEQALEQMEREFGGMGESDNPDPRVLARMMRRMAEIGGEKVPTEMNEMISRLEKGEDPEKLEAEYGDAFDAFDQALDSTEEGKEAAASLRRRRQRVTRDPTLYEMSEFVG